MVSALVLSFFVGFCGDVAAIVESDFLARVEQTELLNSAGNTVSRIERNAAGEITMLRLDDMTLLEEDCEAIGRIESLERLVLFRCPVTDADLDRIGELPNLQSLNLTSTEISDASLSEFASGYPQLHYLCLGNVAVSPEAVERMQREFEAHERELSLGYSRRR